MISCASNEITVWNLRCHRSRLLVLLTLKRPLEVTTLLLASKKKFEELAERLRQ